MIESTQAFEMLKCCALKVTDMVHEQAYFIVDCNKVRDKESAGINDTRH